MFNKHALPLFMTVLIVTSVGCTGSRLRSLITRSDYQSIEDLEAEDSAGKERGVDGKLVSQGRTSEVEESEESEEKAKTQRRGLLNFSALFNRSKDEGDISPDPFVDSSVGEETASSDNRVTPISAASAEDYIAKATKTENVAEEMFREIADESPEFEESNVAADSTAPEIKPASGGQPAVEKSFAEFISELENRAKSDTENAVADAAAPLIEKKKSFEKVAQSPSGAFNDFDRLLGSQRTKEGSIDPGISASELFPGIDELIPATPVVAKVERKNGNTSKFDAFFADDVPKSAKADSPFDTSATLQVAADQRSSGRAEPADPWAAFSSKADSPPGSVSTATNTASLSEGFSWASTASSTRDTKTQKFLPGNTAELSGNGTSSPFVEVSSSRQVDPPKTEMPQSPSTNPFDNSAFVIPTAATKPALISDDAFLASFDKKAADQPANSEPAAAVAKPAPVETTAGAPGLSIVSGFSTRTLFLLLGIVIVALLLFMPERQNRSNR